MYEKTRLVRLLSLHFLRVRISRNEIKLIKLADKINKVDAKKKFEFDLNVLVKIKISQLLNKTCNIAQRIFFSVKISRHLII